VADNGESRYFRHVDLLSTVLLALAAVATAWATYQGAHWRSEPRRQPIDARAGPGESCGGGGQS
jgi:hypothetical protein